MNFEPRHPIETLGTVIAGATFVGLGACKLLRLAMGLSEHDFMVTRFGGPLIWTLSALFILGLTVLFPVGVYLRTRKTPSASRPKISWKHPDGALSPWIHIPLRIIMVGGFFLLLAFLVFAAYQDTHHK